jgi:hypothetical protein
MVIVIDLSVELRDAKHVDSQDRTQHEGGPREQTDRSGKAAGEKRYRRGPHQRFVYRQVPKQPFQASGRKEKLGRHATEPDHVQRREEVDYEEKQEYAEDGKIDRIGRRCKERTD